MALACEQARRRLRLAPDTEAEEHLAVCPTCFDALEREDPLAQALRAGRPELVDVPAGLAPGVIARWRMRRRLPWLAGGGALVAASVGAALLLWFLAVTFTEPVWLLQATLGSVLTSSTEGLLALVELLRSLLVGNPAWLAALLVLAAAAGAGWAVLDRAAQPAPQRSAS
jgi:hypothetical protein